MGGGKTHMEQLKEIMGGCGGGFFLYNHLAHLASMDNKPKHTPFGISLPCMRRQLRQDIYDSLQVGDNVVVISQLAKKFSSSESTINACVAWLRTKHFVLTKRENCQYIINKLDIRE